jgi:hypothetical protein
MTKWRAPEWEGYLTEFGGKAFADLTEEQTCRLNYARAFLLEHREAHPPTPTQRHAPLGQDNELREKMLRESREREPPKTRMEREDEGMLLVAPAAGRPSAASTSGSAPASRQTSGAGTSTGTGRPNLPPPLPPRTTAQAQPANPSGAPETASKHAWEVAEKMAREHDFEDGWDKGYSQEFAAMVEYARERAGRAEEVVPVRDPIELYWPAPRLCDMAEETVARRDHMARRVMAYWAKCVERYGDKMVELGKPWHGKSYRVVLAAQRLSDAIETYATRWRVVTHARPIELVEADCQNAARLYFEAHKALDPRLRAPGPLTTLDPDFVTYQRLCRRWNIKPGTMLHDAKL